MAIHDFCSQRLFVEAALADGETIACSEAQANYLRTVLRLASGARILVFNGRDGEWAATYAPVGKRGAELTIGARVRAQSDGPDIDYLFAPLKRARLDYMVQKATEMGVARLRPVNTRHTIAERINLERMRANAVEAAEQCGLLRVPTIAAPVSLTQAITQWDAMRALIFCDEASEEKNPIKILEGLASRPVGVLIGPEGGFSDEERSLLRAQPFVVALPLGPRIMRADTAAIAALAIVNAVLGDWR
jgi:16S rRNA (uracil1498-N3)-methyltransferase